MTDVVLRDFTMAEKEALPATLAEFFSAVTPADREPGSDDDDETPAIDLEALRREEAKRDERERDQPVVKS